MHGYLKKLVDERNALTGLMQTLDDKAVQEDRGLSESEQERMRGWQARSAELDGEISDQNEYLVSQRAWANLQAKVVENSQDDVVSTGRTSTALATRSGAGDALETRSWGEVFTGSDAFRGYDGHGTSGRVEVSSVLDKRAPIDTGFLATTPSLFVPQQWAMTTPLLDAIGRESVGNGSVEWVVWPAGYPQAGVVAEGALKPEATYAPTVRTGSLQTLAHYKGITRQALEDIPRIQAMVEQALRAGVLGKLESLAADALTASTEIPEVDAGDNLLAGIRVALGNVQAAGYASANAILLNPADFAALDVAVLAATSAGPSLNSTFWGLRAIAVSSVPQGTAYVGDFKTGATLFEIGSTSVYLTDSHADYFLRNILVILAETRALAAITEPQALAKVTLAAPGGGA